MDSTARAHQFLITLLGVDPLVWRRIQVPGEYSFWDLHVAIQDAMGWEDYHLHEFALFDPGAQAQVRIGMEDDSEPSWADVIPDYLTPIKGYFDFRNRDPLALYTYDFGDGWRHAVAFEGFVWSEEDVEYPRCISGERKCPPEDCGGPGGYANFLAALADPLHEDHQTMVDWIGGIFDPAEFDPTQAKFDDPLQRWDLAFG